MPKFIFLIITALLLLPAACTSQNVYDSLRFQQGMQCEKLPGADRDDCMRRTGMSYDEYQQELKKQEQKQ